MLFLAKLYWKQIAIVGAIILALSYIGYLKHNITSLRATVASLEAEKRIISSIGQQQNDKSEKTEVATQKAVTVVVDNSKSEIEKIRRYYENRPTVKSVSVSVCSSTSYSPQQSSSVPESAERVSEAGDVADTASSGQSLESECAAVTSYYNNLYKAWDDACQQFGCK